MTEESRAARIVWLRKYAARRKQFEMWPNDSDLARMEREKGACSSLPILFATGIFTGVYRQSFDATANIWVAWVFPLSVIGLLLYLFYRFLKLRWAIQLLKEQGIESIADLPSNPMQSEGGPNKL